MFIIGADAAKLAGLQIDALTKFREGQLSLEHLERFLNLSPNAREERFGDSKKSKLSVTTAVKKFALLADLGIVTVPEDYVHGTRLSLFKVKYQNEEVKSFYYYNEDLTDKNFPTPSRVLKPGDKLWVRAFQQIVAGETRTKERMDFLDRQPGNQFTGAQGASFVWEQKKDQLPKGKWYVSYDKEENLWQDSGGFHRVPFVRAYSDGDFDFRLRRFEYPWSSDDILLSFCDLPETLVA